jgi:hypothetical protein
MTKALTIICTVAACVAFAIAWQFIVIFEPANPIIPLGLTFVSGFAFRQAFD